MIDMSTQSHVPQYENGNSEDDSTDTDVSFVSSKEVTATMLEEEYDEDSETNGDELDAVHSSQSFYPLLNYNVFIINRDTDTILIGLREKQRVYFCGIFQLQIVKGGIVYNNSHYSASKDYYTMWHPLCSSVPAIQSSYFAGWKEVSHLELRHKDYLTDELKDFHCVIRVRNSTVDGLFQASELYRDVKYLWRSFGGSMHSILSNNCKYSILKEDVDPFIPLLISEEWSTHIDKLSLAHNNSIHDMRVMILGGKNSGKSTFLRLLVENLMTSRSSQRGDKDLWYFDLDPGQPEYSSPECISLNELHGGSKVRGSHLGQPFFETLQEYYIGSNSPQDVPGTYLEKIDNLVELLEVESYVGTSLLNLPGWIKGFGINVLNHVIQKYKPTHIVILETNTSKKHLEELIIPTQFSTTACLEYEPETFRIKANFIKSEESRFNAAQLRTFKTLAYFHTTEKNKVDLKYDFTPLVMRSPFQLSFGSQGIRGIHFFEEFRDLNSNDIKIALEGTIVGLHTYQTDSTEITHKGIFPILNKIPREAVFRGLALIHSIDMAEKFMNIYIPYFLAKNLDKNPKTAWAITRGKTETPLCELSPPGGVFPNKETAYISTERRKKYEHVWKVRKNVLRRGHHM